MHLKLGGKSDCLIFAENQSGTRGLFVFGAFFLFLLLSVSLAIFFPSLRLTPDLIETKEQGVSRNSVAKDFGLVGPSSEEIHDLVYPMPEDVKIAPAVK